MLFFIFVRYFFKHYPQRQNFYTKTTNINLHGFFFSPIIQWNQNGKTA